MKATKKKPSRISMVLAKSFDQFIVHTQCSVCIITEKRRVAKLSGTNLHTYSGKTKTTRLAVATKNGSTNKFVTTTAATI